MGMLPLGARICAPCIGEWGGGEGEGRGRGIVERES